MTSLTLQFNQLVDLAVNPSIGTVNTILLHNLLHVIVDQLQLSRHHVEFHGPRSSAIENAIVNSEQHCGVEISEYEVKEEVDEALGINIEKRILIPTETDRILKVFAIKNVEASNRRPTGFPLNPMQVLLVDDFEKLQTSSIHDLITKVLPNDKCFETENTESSLKAMFDFINLSKRLDALEIGTRQLADIIRKSQCEVDDKYEAIEVIRPELRSLQERIDSLENKVNSMKCKCNEESFEENLFVSFHARLNQEFEDRLATLMFELVNSKEFHENAFKKLQQETKAFEELVCQRLDSYKADFVKSMIEIQSMMDAKLDKFSVPDLKNYLKEMIENLEEKVEKLDYNKALAAGVAKKIFKDLNCVSCGENVIQADARNPKNLSLLAADSSDNHRECNDELQLVKLDTRLCGGRHTVTTPKERIFKSETVKTRCH